MVTNLNSQSKYVNGVVKLHSQLTEAYQKALEVYDYFVGQAKFRIEQAKGFNILIDFNEEQPENQLKGYFVFQRNIVRFLTITFDIALLFPVRNHIEGGCEIDGIHYDEIIEWKKEKKIIRLTFTLIPNEDNIPLYGIKKTDLSGNSLFLDDIGKPFYSFPDIDFLNLVDVPDDICNKQYELVGSRHYTPYMTNNKTYCVLFAQIDNEYDPNAIKVLRWFPVNKGVEIDQLLGGLPNGGDVFFEMGYVSRKENLRLHDFMISNKARILFGIESDNQISLLGSVKIFLNNNLKYPKCLYKIRLQ